MPKQHILFFASFVFAAWCTTQSVHGQPCPAGLKCVSEPDEWPPAQNLTNPGKGCYRSPFVPPGLLCTQHGTYAPLIIASLEGFLTKEINYQIHVLFIYMLAIWNAVTPWHPTALPTDYAPGYGLPFAKRPLTNDTQAACERNTALAYAYLRIMERMLPDMGPPTAKVLSGMGLNPSYKGFQNLSNPADIGNAAAFAVMEDRLPSDGMNLDGNGTFSVPYGAPKPAAFGADLFATPWYDWTKGMPLNDAYALRNITSWQPLLETDGRGRYISQVHVGPQAGWSRPWALTPEEVAKQYVLPAPWPRVLNRTALEQYKQEADAVIQASASLTEFQKLVAEHFDNKLVSFGANQYPRYIRKYQWDLTTALAYDLNLAVLYDAMIVAWRNKLMYQSVRPVSAIRYLYHNTNITAYQGQDKGTGTIPGRKFSSYLRTMPHADYPSGTSCFCSAFAEFSTRFIGTDEIDYRAEVGPGCSTREPDTSPAATVVLAWKTKQEFVQACSYSRLWAGVHFPLAVEGGIKVCKDVGAAGHKKVMQLLHGK